MCVSHNRAGSGAAGRAGASGEMQDEQCLGSVPEDIDLKIALLVLLWFQGGSECAAFELETNPLFNRKCCLPNCGLVRFCLCKFTDFSGTK